MKDVGLVAVVTAVGLVVVGAAVFALHDSSVLVAPPEAVAESFVRQLGMARYELAHHYLADDVATRTSAGDLRTAFEPLRRRTGKPDQVVALVSMQSASAARVLAAIEGRQASAAMYVDLVRERGLWKVAAWPLDIVERP